jgi:hypothetical protein
MLPNMFLPPLFESAWAETLKGVSMMHSQKVKLLLWFATLLSVLALVVVPALANGPNQFTLTVNKAGAGTGTVTSDDGKINCGVVCEATYEPPTSGKLMWQGVAVTLTATPDPGFVFAGWGQDCIQQVNHSGTGAGPGTGPITIYMYKDVTCTANFGLPVGGTIVPVNKLGLLAPWMGLAALALLAVLTVALVRRRGG